MLQNLMDYVIIPFLASGTSRNLTNCASMLSFDFRRVTKFHRLRNDASFWFLACLGTSRIVQQRVRSTSKWSIKGCMPSNNSPRMKLGYDKAYAGCPTLPQCKALRYQLLSFVMTLKLGTYWVRTANLLLGLLEAHARCPSLPQCRALRYQSLSFVMTL